MAVSIRPYAPDDVAGLYDAARESITEVFPWLPWCHPAYQRSEAQDWVEAQVDAFRRGEQYEFVIDDEADHFVGGCGLNNLSRDHRAANLGYWVRTSATGRGVAAAAVSQLARWAFDHTDLQRLEIVAAVGNTRSQRVAERVGARREGIARSRLRLHGVFHDAVIYAITRP